MGISENTTSITINGRSIGPAYPTYVVAEMSGNHNHDFDKAVQILKMAKENGADAIKMQTYTPDTMTINSDEPPFILPNTNTWGGISLYQLYETAYTPWEWQADLIQVSAEIGLDCFSTPFDATAVDFLDDLGVPAFKVASFEVMDIPLLKKIASKGKPVIMSTGMATIGQIQEAYDTLRAEGVEELMLLNCASAYPSPPDILNLSNIPHMAETWKVPIGFSDHSLGIEAALASVALGACLIEKHVTISRDEGGPDAAFSLEPDELKAMTTGVTVVEKAIGKIGYGPSKVESGNIVFQRSMFAVQDIRKGERLTPENVRVIRPGDGLAPRYYEEVIGKSAVSLIKRGTPLSWLLIAD